MKRITVTADGWLAHLVPKWYRGQMSRNIFSLASEEGWEVRMGGQHFER